MDRKRILLVETFPLSMPSQKILKQSIKENNGKLYLTGRLQHANLLNGNERYYPKDILEKAINQYMPKIKNNQAFGQCNHPDSDQIDLERVSHIIKELSWNGDEVIGTIMLTSNQIGKDMQALVIQDGASLSISSRGLGSLKRTTKGDEVQDDYQIIGWDLVAQPSTPNATFHNTNQSIDQKVKKLVQKKTLTETKKEKISFLVNQIKTLLK